MDEEASGTSSWPCDVQQAATFQYNLCCSPGGRNESSLVGCYMKAWKANAWMTLSSMLTISSEHLELSSVRDNTEKSSLALKMDWFEAAFDQKWNLATYLLCIFQIRIKSTITLKQNYARPSLLHGLFLQKCFYSILILQFTFLWSFNQVTLL